MDALKHARHRVKNVREQTQNPSRETETSTTAGKRKLRRKTCGSLTGPGCVAELRKVSDRKDSSVEITETVTKRGRKKSDNNTEHRRAEGHANQHLDNSCCRTRGYNQPGPLDRHKEPKLIIGTTIFKLSATLIRQVTFLARKEPQQI